MISDPWLVSYIARSRWGYTVLAVITFAISALCGGNSVYQISKYRGAPVLGTVSEAISLLKAGEELHVCLTDAQFDCERAGSDSSGKTSRVAQSNAQPKIAIIASFDDPRLCREVAESHRVVGFLSIGNDKDLHDLATCGVDISRFKQSGGRVYRLCTTCGTQDAMLGAAASVLAGFMGYLMVKAERRRRLLLITGERPSTGPAQIRELGILLILLGGAALLTGKDTYMLEPIPLWAAAFIFLPAGLLCVVGSKSTLLLAAFQRQERKLEESGLSAKPSNRSICIQCHASNAPGAVSCKECGSIIRDPH